MNWHEYGARWTGSRDRVRPAIRSKLAYVYTIERNTVVLVERRPHFQDPARHTEHPFAKFVYNVRMGSWSLRWRDRNARWHGYEGFESVPHFRDVLREVEEIRPTFSSARPPQIPVPVVRR